MMGVAVPVPDRPPTVYHQGGCNTDGTRRYLADRVLPSLPASGVPTAKKMPKPSLTPPSTGAGTENSSNTTPPPAGSSFLPTRKRPWPARPHRRLPSPKARGGPERPPRHFGYGHKTNATSAGLSGHAEGFSAGDDLADPFMSFAARSFQG